MKHVDITGSAIPLLILAQDTDPIGRTEWNTAQRFDDALALLCEQHEIAEEDLEFICAIGTIDRLADIRTSCSRAHRMFFTLDTDSNDTVALATRAGYESYRAAAGYETHDLAATLAHGDDLPACLKPHGVLETIAHETGLCTDVLPNEPDRTDNPHKVRPLLLNDIPHVMRIEFSCFPDPWSPMAYLADLLMNPNAIYLCVAQKDSLLGFIGFWITGQNASITKIAVSPLCQRQGIATRLIDETLRICTLLGKPALDLEVRAANITARKFYRSCGFHERGLIADYYIQPNDDGVALRRIL